MGGGLKSLRGLTKSVPAANRGRGPLGGVKRDFTRLNRKVDATLPNGPFFAINGSLAASRSNVTANRSKPTGA